MTKPIPFALPPSLYQTIVNLLKDIADSLAADNVLVAADEKSCRRLREQVRKQKHDAVAAETKAPQNESDPEGAPPAKKRKTLPPLPLLYSS